jgi:SAM-dependent methyltransferase
MKLDLGCGSKKAAPDFIGVDARPAAGVDIVFDLRHTPWPWQDDEVDFVHCAHFVEHLTGSERIAFFDELWRVMKPGAKAVIITPDWTNASAYGDPTHQWPPMSYWYSFYLDRDWRAVQAAHVAYTCHFKSTYAYTPTLRLKGLTDEVARATIAASINAVAELVVTLVKHP